MKLLNFLFGDKQVGYKGTCQEYDRKTDSWIIKPVTCPIKRSPLNCEDQCIRWNDGKCPN
jgi:hypothetical protein